MKKEKGKKKETTKKPEQKTNWFAWLLFLAYLTLLFYLLFFAETYGRTEAGEDYRYNLTLFKEIKRFWQNWETVGIESVIVNLAGNILAFVPFGFFMPMICKRGKKVFCCTMMSALFSLAVETVQLFTKVGAFDVDDILLNCAGALIGIIFMIAIPKIKCYSISRS